MMGETIANIYNVLRETNEEREITRNAKYKEFETRKKQTGIECSEITKCYKCGKCEDFILRSCHDEYMDAKEAAHKASMAFMHFSDMRWKPE